MESTNTNLPKSAAFRSSSSLLWGYFGVTFVLSWGFWFGSGIFSRPTPTEIRDVAWFIAQLGVFVPSVVALVFAAIIDRANTRTAISTLAFIFLPVSILGGWIALGAPEGILHVPPFQILLVGIAALWVILFFSPSNRYLAAFGPEPQERSKRLGWILLSVVLLPVLFFVAWLFVSAQTRDFSVSLFSGTVSTSLASIVAVFVFNLLYGGSLGEEIGWRGFALPQLLLRFTPLQASLILGFVWALWHFPIDVQYGFGLPGPGAFVVRLIWTLPLTIAFTWFYLRSRRSLLVPLLLHTSINFLSDLGFSNYEPAMALFMLLAIVFGAVAGFRLNRNPEGRTNHV